MTFWKWSQTPASNATADSTINWAEGQAPSSVNDSARAMMAATAKYRDDVSGAITATGTSSAYVVTSNQVFDSLAHLRLNEITFICPATNAAGVTLNVDGLGAQAINGVDGVAIPAGTLISGGVYTVTAYTGEYILHDFYGNPYNIPLGGFLAYAGTTAPNSSFALPYGQAISRTTYATLFSLVGSTYGAGDASTTFNIPDLRGRGIFFKDDMGGSAASRITSAVSGIDAANLSATGGSQSHTLTTAELPVHSHTNTLTDPGHAHIMYETLLNNVTVGGPAQAVNLVNNVPTATQVAVVASTTGITITNANAGSGSAHAIMPPAYILNCIMRVI